MPEVGTLVVKAPKSAKARMAASVHSAGVAADHIESIEPPDGTASGGPQHRVIQVNAPNNNAPTPDPAYSIPGLLWNEQRVNMTDAWKVTAGDPAVTVGVADTGLDYTHSELAPKVVHVEDFTQTEDPPICKTYFSPSASDADWAATYGGPANTDWNGHGSWIGGNIAGALDGVGINGIAPKVNLVALKISQWCGSAYDSEILASFVYAADHGINIVSISFGGYLDKSDPDQALILKQYAAGREVRQQQGHDDRRRRRQRAPADQRQRQGHQPRPAHHSGHGTGRLLRLLRPVRGAGRGPGRRQRGVDREHGERAPRRLAARRRHRDEPTFVCKPTRTRTSRPAPGKQDQLAYYSNYGPRIDVAAPGWGPQVQPARLGPGGTPGLPYTTADGFAAWEDFSITSNWALEIPCFVHRRRFPRTSATAPSRGRRWRRRTRRRCWR